MIRYGKRLKKRTILDYVECRLKRRLEEELEAEDVEVSPWEAACYRVVEDYSKMLIEKDAKIAALESDLAVAHESEVRQAEIVRQRDEARAELRRFQRFQNNESTFTANAVSGIDERAAIGLVSLAEKALGEQGGKVSFSAACAVVLKRELDKAREANRVLSEKYAEPKKMAPPFHIKNGKIISHRHNADGSETIVLQGCEYVKEHIEPRKSEPNPGAKLCNCGGDGLVACLPTAPPQYRYEHAKPCPNRGKYITTYGPMYEGGVSVVALKEYGPTFIQCTTTSTAKTFPSSVFDPYANGNNGK